MNSIRDKFQPFLLGLRNRHFVVIDLVILCISPLLAMEIRLESLSAVDPFAQSVIFYTLTFVCLKPLVFWGVGLYGRYWPYASIDALRTIALAAFITLCLEVSLFFGIFLPLNLVPAGFPHSVPLLDAVLSMILVGSSRLAVRALFEWTNETKGGIAMKPVLIAGAGVAGSMVAKELRMNSQVGLNPVGYLDDDPRKHGMRIQGIPVVGKLADLPIALKEYNIEQVIIAMPTAPGRVVKDLVQACTLAGVVGRTIPGVFEIASGIAKVSELRDIQIEDLLRRGIIRSDPQEVAHLVHNKRVMVTGAGGSIGSELCRQIGLCNPAEIVLLGHGENSIFKIATELTKRLPASSVPPVIADIRDKERMETIFAAHRPEIIFHAAAHKHVGLMQTNVAEAITNNVLGTRNLVELSAEYGVERFVMISSDKAVNPTSMMGVTKRIAELIVHDAAMATGKPFVSVRFGNVLGSRGSVVPIFKSQIAIGGPVTVSHPDVTRYFMTIPEAVQLVLHAGALGTGGEVFLLDMGEPIRIVDLAKDVIRLSGLTEGRDIDIVFTGLKPGEKLHEELFQDHERPVRSKHDKIFVCPNGLGDTKSPRSAGSAEGEGDMVFRQAVQDLVDQIHFNNLHETQEIIRRIVPEYQPTAEMMPPVTLAPIRSETYLQEELVGRRKESIKSPDTTRIQIPES
jgi:FlaA1/EpsC-like NDP-sugar epimerase